MKAIRANWTAFYTHLGKVPGVEFRAGSAPELDPHGDPGPLPECGLPNEPPARRTRGGLPKPPGVAIIAVEDRASFQSWIHVMRIGFGTPEAAEPDLLEVFAAVGSGPQMRTYLALLDDQPVVTSQVFLAAGVAGIYQVTCLPEARGRGIGTAVTLASLLDARRRGYAIAILQASDLGYPVYRRLGFREYGRLNEYQYNGEQRPADGR
jgi:GNAT superfamily N-acetyltransferase